MQIYRGRERRQERKREDWISPEYEQRRSEAEMERESERVIDLSVKSLCV